MANESTAATERPGWTNPKELRLKWLHFALTFEHQLKWQFRSRISRDGGEDWIDEIHSYLHIRSVDEQNPDWMNLPLDTLIIQRNPDRTTAYQVKLASAIDGDLDWSGKRQKQGQGSNTAQTPQSGPGDSSGEDRGYVSKNGHFAVLNNRKK